MFESYTFNNHKFEIHHKVDSDGITVKVYLNNTKVGYEYFCSADGISSQDGNSSLNLLKEKVKSDIKNGMISF